MHSNASDQQAHKGRSVAEKAGKLVQSKSAAGREDNRKEAIAQRKLQHVIDSSRQLKKNQPVVQRVDWSNVEHDRITVEGDENEYVAYYDGEKAGELSLYEDEKGRKWINNVSTDSNYQKKGIGLSLLVAAIKNHGAVFAAKGMQKHEAVEDDDTRYLSEEGVALVKSALRNEIMFDDWCFNPATEFDYFEEIEEEKIDKKFLRLSQFEIIDQLKKGKLLEYDVRQWVIGNYEKDEQEGALADIFRAADRF
jgi:hypothetical protein